MMGMGQQMPMRRPPTGPSQMTAGRPNPMAGFQGGANPVGPRYGPMGGGASPVGPQYGGGGGPVPPQVTPGYFGGPAQGVGPQYGGASPVGPNFAMPLLQGGPGSPMGVDPGDTPQVAYPQGGPQGYTPQVMGGGGMSDAMMHPFAPRNRQPQFPGAAMRGIMGGMGPQMPQRQPPMPPWAQMGGQQRWL